MRSSEGRRYRHSFSDLRLRAWSRTDRYIAVPGFAVTRITFCAQRRQARPSRDLKHRRARCYRSVFGRPGAIAGTRTGDRPHAYDVSAIFVVLHMAGDGVRYQYGVAERGAGEVGSSQSR